MKKYAVTISREFGCNGRAISRGLASKLGVTFYDKDLIDLTARKIGVNRETIYDAEEYVNKEKEGLFSDFGYGSTNSFFSEKAIRAQAEVIREAANKGPCLLFGRCADYVLREYSDCMNIFLYAPIEARIQHIAQTYGITEKAADKLIKRIDKQRHNYYKYVTGKDRGDRHGKHIMIDTSLFGEEGSISVLYEACKIRLGIED